MEHLNDKSWSQDTAAHYRASEGKTYLEDLRDRDAPSSWLTVADRAALWCTWLLVLLLTIFVVSLFVGVML